MRAGIHLARVGLAVALLAGLAAGCGGDDDSGDLDLGGGTPTPTATTEPGATPTGDHPGGPITVRGDEPADAEKNAQRQAWVDYYTAITDAAAVPDPNWPALSTTMTPDLYGKLRDQVQGLADKNQSEKGPITLEPRFTRVDGEERLLGCVFLSEVRRYDAQGNTVDAEIPDVNAQLPTFGMTDQGLVVAGFDDADDSLCEGE